MSNSDTLLNVYRKYISDKPVNILTRRETEVSILIAEGMTNKEIAKKLYLSIKTVVNHVSKIYTKLNVPNRSQAIVFILKHDITNLSSMSED